MNGLPQVADLDAVAGILPDPAGRKKLRGLAASLRQSQSCIADVRMAEQICRILRAGIVQPQMYTDFDRAALHHSLISSAIILYTRATSGEAKRGGRGSQSLHAQLPTELHSKHATIVTLRHKAFAHVHSNQFIRGEFWNQSFVFLVDENGSVRPGAATTPIKIRDSVLADLEALIPEAEAIMQKRYAAYLEKLNPFLEKLSWVELAKCFVPAQQLFGSEEQARAILLDRHSGKTIGIAIGQ